MAAYPGFTYDVFNVILKYITANLSSNKNYNLNTTFKNHYKLRLCCEYFQKWTIEQAITFKKTNQNKQKTPTYFPDSSADMFIYLKSGCMYPTEVIRQFQRYSEETFDLQITGRMVERMLKKVFSFF